MYCARAVSTAKLPNLLVDNFWRCLVIDCKKYHLQLFMPTVLKMRRRSLSRVPDLASPSTGRPLTWTFSRSPLTTTEPGCLCRRNKTLVPSFEPGTLDRGSFESRLAATLKLVYLKVQLSAIMCKYVQGESILRSQLFIVNLYIC